MAGNPVQALTLSPDALLDGEENPLILSGLILL